MQSPDTATATATAASIEPEKRYDDFARNDEDDFYGRNGDDNRVHKRILLQRFTIYNSTNTIYIVGSNAKESLYRIMEIGRDSEDETSLSFIEDKNYFYTRKDVIELLNSLNDSIDGGIHKLAHGYGLLGLIRFTKGYYLSLITKCSQVAIIGGHYIYHIDETKLVPLGTNYKKPEKYSDEDKLLSIFRYMDLGKTFYFSYNYDITNSLQTNIMRHKMRNHDDSAQSGNNNNSSSSGCCGCGNNNELYRSFEHNDRFVWNNLLLRPPLQNEDVATYEWFQPIVHGFIDQANISIYGKKFYITIIARRSHHFAGARFLKRGTNNMGNVANEIETEQIVSDMLTTSFHDTKYGMYNNPRYTSFVQHRGSIPLYWTQDMNKLPKPPIKVNLPDPYYQSSALHFDNLFYRYGSPVIILNLIKQKEKQPRESKLNVQYINCIRYLNQFLPQESKLQYHAFDMSKHSKKNLDVITPLQDIATEAIDQIGIFHNGTTLARTKLQSGIIRTNCIDCLDRTNAAQFIIGKEALTKQLQSLKIISQDKTLDYDSDLINILTEIFHDHGDTIAIQYGGSNLVNTMDSYRRINQWSSHTRDMLNSIKRMYSNSFMDTIRQESINLFLGNYEYSPDMPKLWDLASDFALHNDLSIDYNSRAKRSYTCWYNERNLDRGRFRIDVKPETKGGEVEDELPKVTDISDKWFNECYIPRKYQSFGEIFQYGMNSNSRYFPSGGVQGLQANGAGKLVCFDYSPFESRKFRNGDKRVGEQELSYLEHDDSSDNVAQADDSMTKYNPKNIKNFLASKITSKLKNREYAAIGAYSRDGNSPSSRESNSNGGDDNEQERGGREPERQVDDDGDDDEVGCWRFRVSDEDAKLYQAQFDCSTIMNQKRQKMQKASSNVSMSSTTKLKPKAQDQEMYNFYCSELVTRIRDAHNGNYLDMNLIPTRDLKMYGSYCHEYKEEIDLSTDFEYI
ncbi:uncharacterized protein LODBEIA_P40670 [Lodderomyces beijingensis]|uniref:SAC domain-containing protein n=1 Tax=Lodderomyces beijingensis TaxID=1775926 RepID=A0ABP0ZQ77_9ASCO